MAQDAAACLAQGQFLLVRRGSRALRGASVIWIQAHPLVKSNISSLVVAGTASWPVVGPVSATVAYIGDSITVQAVGSTAGGYVQQDARGPAWWARAFSNQRFTTPTSFIKGVGGNTTTQMLARITDVTALDAGIVVIQGGVNDVAAGASLATITANIEAMIHACRLAGQVVVLQGPHPESSATTFTAGQLAIWAALRDWMIARHRPEHGVWSNISAWDDIASTPGGDVAATGMLRDTIHPNPRASRFLGSALSQMLNDIIDADDPWDSGTNLINNPTLTGTAGSKVNGVTGNVATSWTASAGAALSGDQTIVASLVARGDGTNFQRFVISGTWAGSSLLSFYTAQATWGVDWNIGDVVDISADIICDPTGTDNLNYTEVGVYYKAGVFTVDGLNSSTDPGPVTPFTVKPGLIGFTFPADATRNFPLFGIAWRPGAVAITIDIGHPVLKRIV